VKRRSHDGEWFDDPLDRIGLPTHGLGSVGAVVLIDEEPNVLAHEPADVAPLDPTVFTGHVDDPDPGWRDHQMIDHSTVAGH
jgi:hypothetical protein